jgi:hypothetical protein
MWGMEEAPDDYTTLRDTVFIKTETKKAILCVTEKDEEIWIPKSVLECEYRVGTWENVSVYTWFYDQEGLE